MIPFVGLGQARTARRMVSGAHVVERKQRGRFVASGEARSSPTRDTCAPGAGGNAVPGCATAGTDAVLAA